jgi:hypothetical protein
VPEEIWECTCSQTIASAFQNYDGTQREKYAPLIAMTTTKTGTSSSSRIWAEECGRTVLMCLFSRRSQPHRNNTKQMMMLAIVPFFGGGCCVVDQLTTTYVTTGRTNRWNGKQTFLFWWTGKANIPPFLRQQRSFRRRRKSLIFLQLSHLAPPSCHFLSFTIPESFAFHTNLPYLCSSTFSQIQHVEPVCRYVYFCYFYYTSSINVMVVDYYSYVSSYPGVPWWW